jgi:hypothetical protein
MFASETILLNPVVACLEFTNVAKWRVRDVIVTDRAVYFFATVKPLAGSEDNAVANYLTSQYERLDVRHFRAERASEWTDLPPFIAGFTKIVQLANQ